MKVIKKYFKVALCFMAFAIMSFIFAFNPSIASFAAVEATGSAVITEFNALKLPTKFDVESSADGMLRVPLLTSGTGYTVRVIDPAGQEHNYVQGSSSDDYFSVDGNQLKIATLTNGTYKVVYIVTNNGKTYYSNTHRITVTNVSYELNFKNADNTVTLVKPTVAANSALVELPNPTIRKTGTETDITNKTFEIEVTRDGERLDPQVKASEDEVTANDFFVKIGDTYYLNPSFTQTEINDNKEKAQFVIKYSFNEGYNPPSKPFTVNVVKGFEEPKELEIATPTLPKFELGDKDIELPRPTLSNEYSNNAEYNITSIVIEKESDSSIKLELQKNTTKFDMTLEAFKAAGVNVTSYSQLVGNYLIKYTLEDAYGKSVSKELRKEGLTISSNPTAYMAYNYTITDTEGVKTVSAKPDTDYAADLKSEYLYSNIVLPGIYGEDKVSSFNDLVLVRTIVDSETKEVYYVDNYKYDSAQGKAVPLSSADNGNAAITVDVTEDNINEFVLSASSARVFKFKGEDIDQAAKAGKYILRYEVYSKNVKSRSGKLVDASGSEYTFQVKTAKSVSTQEIKITNISKTVAAEKGEEITVKVSATDTVDSRQQTYVFITNTSDNLTTIQSKFQQAANEANEAMPIGQSRLFDYETFKTELGYTLTPATLVEGTTNTYKFTATETDNKVIAVTLNDNGDVLVATRDISLKNTEHDSVPATSAIIKANDFNTDKNATTLQQVKAYIGDVITLPDIQFTDTADSTYNGDSSLSLNVVYYIDTPETEIGLKYMSPSDCIFTNDTVYGGQITASKKGTYHVVYSATDDAGNTSVVAFSFVVDEVIEPVITLDVTSDNDTFNFENGTVTTESGAIVTIDARDEVSSEVAQVKISQKGLYYQSLGDGKYQFFGVGTYNVDVSLASNPEISRSFKIKVNEQKLEWSEDFSSVPEYGKNGEEVFLPMATTNDGSQVSVKVTLGKDGEEVDVEYVNNGWKFTPTKNGVYYVQYSAENEYVVLDDSTSQFTINVGDSVPPQLTMTAKNQLSQDIVYNGSNIELNFDINTSSKKLIVTAVSNGTQLFSVDTGLSITDKNDAGQIDRNTYALWSKLKVELSSTKGSFEEIDQDVYDYQFVLSSTGKYTVKLTAEDKYEKIGELEFSFNVVSNSVEAEKNDNAAGIALIITSAVILVGVIAFFVLTGKKGGTKKSKKSKTTVAEEVEVEDKTEEKTESSEEAKSGEIEE
ncbi:MAG: hypothetical protein IKM43_02320 [Clostridia bacterium]|nr:hypothetical protein [Clostridia bacterium]